VISIKKFLKSDRETDRTLLHVIRLLIHGIGEHTLVGEPGDGARFHHCIQEVSEALTEDIEPEDLLVHAGSVVKALEDHNRLTSLQQAQHSAELQNMVKMLTSTVRSVVAAGDTNVSRLTEIETRVASASELDDVRLIKSNLSDCLNDIRNEAERQRKENDSTLEQLGQALDQCRKQPKDLPETTAHDPVTGLAQRPAAETALALASQGGAAAYAAVLVLDRLQAVNLRFGREVGDEVLNEFARTIRKKLSRADQLFRWNGPVLLALVNGPSSIEIVRTEIARIVETKLEHTIETTSRSIMIPIAARWAVFPMMAAPRLLYQRIDTFTAVGARD
jgi:diguanylate cyclase (GGDEF)-like protein